MSFLEDQLSDEQRKKKVKISKLMVNNTDLLPEAEKCIKIKKISDKYHSVYSYYFIFERKLEECSNHRIVVEYEYDIPMFDTNQSYKLMLPCKNFMHKIYIDRGDYDNWELAVSGFASFFYSGSILEEKFKVNTETSHSCEINFTNWVLPGAGYVVLLKRKST